MNGFFGGLFMFGAMLLALVCAAAAIMQVVTP